MEKHSIKVFIKINENNLITTINSSIFLNDTTGYVQIDEGQGDKYAHAQGSYLNKGLVDEKGKYNYKYVDNKVIELTEEEKESLFPIKQPTKEELLKKQLLETQATLAEMQMNILMKDGGIA